jgi:septal ring factor EnvC (AmiA/AmiB activator)
MQKDLKAVFGTIQGLDEKSVEFLTNALAKNNLPGFDYLEFKLSVGRLLLMAMPEDTAYKSTFTTASTVGLTKEKLISTAQHYKEILLKEKEQFDLALNNQLQKRVKSKQEEVEKLKIQIENWKVQIENLKTQIAKSQATIDTADEQIGAEMRKIETTKDNFEHTYRSILSQIELDMQNVQKYL